MGTVFSAYDFRGRIDDTLTVQTAWSLGSAFTDWLTNDGEIVVVKAETVNEEIARGFIEGVLLLGRNVIDAGNGDANTVVAEIKARQIVGGALVAHDNLQQLEIITLFDDGGRVVTTESGLTEINDLVASGNFLPSPEKGKLLT